MVVTKIICVVLVIFVSIGVGSGERPKKKRIFGCVLPDEPLYGYFEFEPRKREIIYHCEDGFVPVFGHNNNHNSRYCRNRKWTGTDGDCKPVYNVATRCQTPENPKHGHVFYSTTEEGTGEVWFWCEPGYRLIGAKKLTCRNKSTWTGGPFPICRSQQTVEDLANIMKEDFFYPLAATTRDSGDNDVKGYSAAGKTGLDMIMLLDVSASIGKKSLETAKKFLKLIVEQFGISPDPSGGRNGTRVALITFSTKADVVFELDDKDARSVEDVSRNIDAVENKGGGTNLEDGLAKAAIMTLFKLPLDKRRFAHASRVVFIVTDAETTFVGSAKINKLRIGMHVAALKGQNFEIFAIGVGLNIDRDMLESIASQPPAEHVFLTKEFDDLNRVRDIIAEKNVDYGQCGISGNFEIQRDDTESKEGAWPWLGWLGVMLFKDVYTGAPDMSVTCGGTLLCDRWFLTVAHCVSYVDGNGKLHTADTRMINLNLGDHNIYKMTDANHIITGVQKIHIHPRYTGEENEYGVRDFDVAMLDLGDKTAVPLNKFIRPICFPTQVKKDNDTEGVYGTSEAMFQSLLRSNRNGFTAGWGHAPINAHLAKLPWDTLSQVRRPLQSPDRCRKRYPGLDTDKFFCVFNSFGETSYCRGDVGGPFMDEMANDRFTVLGLAARTHDCTEDDGFSIFLNVINPDISNWVGEKLNGCNRVAEDAGWAERMRQKWDAIKKEREEARNNDAREASELVVKGKSGKGNGKREENRKNRKKGNKKRGRY